MASPVSAEVLVIDVRATASSRSSSSSVSPTLLEMAESDVECRLVALNANEWMQASFQQASGFPHEFTCEKKAPRYCRLRTLVLEHQPIGRRLWRPGA